MTTKQEERKALQQIETILATLEPDGYVNTAFDGVIDVARTNIENDWACSMQDRAESAERALTEEKATHDKNLQYMAAKLNDQTKRAEEAEKALQARNLEYNKAMQAKAEAEEDADHYFHQMEAAEAEAATVKAENEALRNEIIRLKARLFDMMEAANL